MPVLTAFLCSVTFASAQVADLGRFEVVTSNRKDRFAGRLGYRVEETLNVQKDGRRYVVVFPEALVRKPSRLPRWAAGETVAVRGRLRGHSIRAERKDVQTLPGTGKRPSEPKRGDQ
ncbi:MAG: hypothetical protein ACO1SV_15225 [Fimbriimonas sp.]